MKERTSLETERLARQVGERIRSLRLERGYSIQELAEKIEISKLTLGNMERGEANPSLSVIWKVANGLAVPLSYLLNDRQAVSVSRSGEGSRVISANGACTLEPMFDSGTFGSVEIHRAVIEPLRSYMSGPHQTGVMEYVTVMKGTAMIEVDGESVTLNEFDAIRFHGDRLHTYTNTGETALILHFVMTYPAGKE